MLIYHCHSPHSPNLSFAVGETVAQKGEATCPIPYRGSDVNPEIRLHNQSGGLSTVQKERCIDVNEDVVSILHGGGGWAIKSADLITKTPAGRTVILL